jgi:hypothetical protein
MEVLSSVGDFDGVEYFETSSDSETNGTKTLIYPFTRITKEKQLPNRHDSEKLI